MENAGIAETAHISIPPSTFYPEKPPVADAERLDNLLKWTKNDSAFHSLYWIDPLANDATEQVSKVVNAGVEGFKIICDRFYPSDQQCLKTCAMIAKYLSGNLTRFFR